MNKKSRQFVLAQTRAITVSRRGFTMVELLIAVAILVILTTLAVSAFNLQEADRVGNSIGTFKNALEGARSRAISSGEVRGLRLILDPNDPDNNMVKSVVYIGSAGIEERTGNILFERTMNRWVFGPSSTTVWEDLIDRGLIKSGARIEIPVNSGRWYTVTGGTKDYTNSMETSSFFTAGNREVLFLAEHYHPSRATTSGGNATFSASPNNVVTVGLELEPITLEGSEPILFDPQTCVDLGGSRVPSAWRILEDKDQDRSFDTMMGDVDEDGDGQFDYVAGYNQMDILFGPDGSLTGTASTSGVMNFRFAYVSDVVMFQGNRQIPSGDSFPNFTTYTQFMVPANPEKGQKVLSIFPQTGGIIISDIDPTPDGTAVSSPPGNGFNSQYASQPFSFAMDGKESN